MDTIRKILSLLTPAEKKRGLLVLFLVIGLALLETAGVASVMPFLAVLSNPEIIQENALLSSTYAALNFTSTDSFLFALGIASFALIIFGAVFRTGTQYAMYRYTEMRRHSISYRLLKTYLRQPYAFFLNRHSGDLSKSLLSEVDELVKSVFQPVLNIIAYAIAALAIIGFLIFIDPFLAFVVGASIGTVYILVFKGVRGVLKKIGRNRALANTERYTLAGEALTGIKDIKVLGRETSYLTRFRKPSNRYARYQSANSTISIIPKYAIEAVGFGGIIGLALYLMAQNQDDLSATIPILGLYAFAGYRLLPAAQQIYAGMTKLRFGLGAVDEVYRDLVDTSSLPQLPKNAVERMVPAEQIRLRDLTFTYEGMEEPALRGVNMEVPIGQAIGIIGTTGAGKTTVVDILLGLLTPTEGVLEVDGVVIGPENVRQWQSAIGYVPQDIFLADATITENIAFGIPLEEIDQEAVERAAKMAQIHDFIVDELPQGYQTAIGERGVRISGGQRQRIGIARALYHDPPVLVFDEATSALDNATEAQLIQAIEQLQGQKTTITIAHRLTTVAKCDRVYLFKQGAVHAAGTYDELLHTDPELRRLAGPQYDEISASA